MPFLLHIVVVWESLPELNSMLLVRLKALA